MRILYLCDHFPLLSETFILHEIHDLLEQGCDVRVLALNTPPPEKYSDLPERLGYAERIHVLEHPAQSFRWLRTLKLMTQALLRGHFSIFQKTNLSGYSRRIILEVENAIREQNWQPEIIHCHFGPMGQLGALLKFYGLTPAKLSTIFHGFDISSYIKDKPDDYYSTLFTMCDLSLAVNTHYLDKIRSLGAAENKSALFHIGVDIDGFNFKPRKVDAATPLRLVSVGRMTEKKGHRYSVEAIATIRKQRPDLDIHLDLIGDGPLLPEIQTLVRELNLEECITLHGALQHSKAMGYLRDAHIFTLPSVTAADGDMEGIPVSLMEAMATGLPVVSTHHSGIPELVEHGVSGFLSEERDVEGLANNILTLVDMEPKSMDKMLQAAREKVENDFNRKKQAEILQEKLNTLVK